jgi:hypothetical protein
MSRWTSSPNPRNLSRYRLTILRRRPFGRESMVALTSGLSNQACKCFLRRMSRLHQQRGSAVFPKSSVTVRPRFAWLRRTFSPDEALIDLTVTAMDIVDGCLNHSGRTLSQSTLITVLALSLMMKSCFSFHCLFHHLFDLQSKGQASRSK